MNRILFNDRFKAMMSSHAREVLRFLVSNEIYHTLVCQSNGVEFNPPIELSGVGDLVSFYLAGHSFDTIRLSENNIEFEAGFGADNVASIVSVNFSQILHIVIPSNQFAQNGVPIFTNATHPILYNISQEELEQSYKKQEKHLEHSLLALCSNPLNEKFFSK